jgi:hypothetical protein
MIAKEKAPEDLKNKAFDLSNAVRLIIYSRKECFSHEGKNSTKDGRC